MNDSLFGKQGKPKAAQTAEPQATPEEPMMDFWSDEAHKPDSSTPVTPTAIVTPTATPTNPIQSEPATAPTAPVATPHSEGQLPASNELIKPFEDTNISTDETPAITPELAPLEPAPQIQTTSEEQVREIGSARFRRLDEPVDLSSTQEQTIEPVIKPVIAPVTETTPEAVIAEPQIVPTPIPEPSMVEEAVQEPVAPETTAPIKGTVKPENAISYDNLWGKEQQATPVIATATETVPTLETAVAAAPEIAAPLAAEMPEIEVPSPANPELQNELQNLQEEENLLEDLEIDPIAEEPAITADVLDELDKVNSSSATGEETDLAFELMNPGELAGMKTPPPAGADDSLQTLLAEHAQWLDSDGTSGRRAVFREENNLAGIDLSHQRLSGASFRGINLARCKFTQAQLSEADFGDCQLEGSDFTAATLTNAIFTQANINSSAFSAAQAQNTDFSAAQVQDCNFTQANLQEANFRDANLKDTNLQQSTATLANFRGANMENVDLNHSNLIQTIFREANLTNAKFEGAEVIHAHFKDAALSHVDLNSADFSQAQDISAEVQAQFMQVERANLHNEVQKLDHIRDELEQRERALIAEREQLQRQLQNEKNQQAETKQQMPDLGDVATKFKKGSRLFLFFGIGWFLLSFLLAIILQNVISQLDSSELSLIEMILMGVLMLVPLLFFIVSMSKSFSLSYALRKLTPRDPNEPT